MSDFFETVIAVESLIVGVITLVSTFGGIWLKKRWRDKNKQNELESESRVWKI